jgi:hypothetical protein
MHKEIGVHRDNPKTLGSIIRPLSFYYGIGLDRNKGIKFQMGIPFDILDDAVNLERNPV